MVKKVLLVLLFFILLAPYVQHRFGIIDSGTLHGYFTNSPDVDFTLDGWFDGSYQQGINSFYNDHIGFREDLVRLNAQMDYTLFQKLDYGGTILGDDNYLYFSDYVDSYFGRDFIGQDIIRQRLLKLRRLQDTFASMGKSLILVHAPCKVWYYPEHVPQVFHNPKGRWNNYECNVRIADSIGINQIDFNKWFLSMKKTTTNLLYSRQGIHWTNYGAILAFDSIVKFIEGMRGIHMTHPKWDKVIRTTDPQLPDNDMADILNLVFPITVDTLSYPEVYYTTDSNTQRPKCIYIGDSYVINLLRTGVMQHIYSDWEFWFYFKDILDEATYAASSYPKIADYDWKKKVAETDCIILLQTPKNEYFIGNGFIEEMYAYYFPGKE